MLSCSLWFACQYATTYLPQLLSCSEITCLASVWRAQVALALWHFPDSHYVKDVIIFRNDLRLFLLSVLHLSGSVNLFLPQCFLPLFITNSFSPVTAAKGPGWRGILQHVSKKIIFVCSLPSFKEGHSVVKHSQNRQCLVSRTSHLGTVFKAFNLSVSLIPIQPHQYFLSSLSFKIFRPTQSTSVGVDATTIFNTNCSELQQCYLLTNPPKIWFFFSLLTPVVSWCILWTIPDLIHGSPCW